MHILVHAANLRIAVVIPASATVYELKEKVAKQAARPNGGGSLWPADIQELLLDGEPLPDEMTLAECCVRDRDRIELRKREEQPSGGAASASAALEPLLGQVDACAQLLAGYESQLARREPVHQELFTRLLERLDSLSLDGLTDEERAFARTQRKELVRRTQEVSAAAGRIG